MSNHEGKGHLEVIKDGVADLNDAVESLQLPGVSTAYSVAAWVAHKWEAKKFEAFLDGIRIRLDLDREQLLREMHDNKDKRWMAEGLARGWRLSLEAMDESARESAYLMVADYMARKKDPDRLHRQLSTLLMEADGPSLRLIRQITDAKMAAGGRYAFVAQSVRHPERSNERFYEVQDGHEHYRILEGIEDPHPLQIACDLLVRAGFMSVWFGHMEMPHARPGLAVYAVYGEIKHHKADSWLHLHDYLKPVLKG